MINKLIPEKLQGTRLLIALSVLGILLLVFLIHWLLELRIHVKTDDAYITGHLHPISPRIPGTIIGVYVDDNQMVSAGQLLIQLDPKDYQVSAQKAKAALETSKAQAKAATENIALSQSEYKAQITQAKGTLAASHDTVGQSQHALKEAKSAVEAAKDELEKADANLQHAWQDQQRYTAVDPRAVSAQQRDLIHTNYEAALAARNAAQANVYQSLAKVKQIQKEIDMNRSKVTESQGVLENAESQKHNVRVQKNQAQSSKMSVAQATAALKEAQLNLSYTKIFAPVDGKVGQKAAEVGQRVQPGQSLLAVVQPNLWVVANLKETQLEHVRPGQSVDIHIDAFPKHTFKGIVESIAPGSGAQFALLPPDNATGNFIKIVQRVPVKILFTKDSIRGYEDLLIPGMSTVISIDVHNTANRKQD